MKVNRQALVLQYVLKRLLLTCGARSWATLVVAMIQRRSAPTRLSTVVYGCFYRRQHLRRSVCLARCLQLQVLRADDRLSCCNWYGSCWRWCCNNESAELMRCGCSLLQALRQLPARSRPRRTYGSHVELRAHLRARQRLNFLNEVEGCGDKTFLRAGWSISGIPCLTRSALVLRLVSANPLKTLICRHICSVTDHVNRPSLSLLMC